MVTEPHRAVSPSGSTQNTSSTRNNSGHTNWAGWWGLFAFFGNFYAIGQNLSNRRKIVALPEPTPPNRALYGAPLTRRPGLYVGVGLLGLLGYFIITEVTTSDAEALDGKCVLLESDSLQEVSCSSRHDAKVIDVVNTDEFCPPETDDAFVLQSDVDHALCLDFDR